MTKIDLLIEYLELSTKQKTIELAKARFRGNVEKVKVLELCIEVIGSTLELLKIAKRTNNSVLKELNELLELSLY